MEKNIENYTEEIDNTKPYKDIYELTDEELKKIFDQMSLSEIEDVLTKVNEVISNE